MLHDIIRSLLVVTCHYTSGNLFYDNPDIPRPWEKEEGDEFE